MDYLPENYAKAKIIVQMEEWIVKFENMIYD